MGARGYAFSAPGRDSPASAAAGLALPRSTRGVFFVIASRRVSSASAAADLLLFEWPKRSRQEKGHPDVPPAIEPRVRAGEARFANSTSCAGGKQARIHARFPGGLSATPSPPHRGPALGARARTPLHLRTQRAVTHTAVSLRAPVPAPVLALASAALAPAVAPAVALAFAPGSPYAAVGIGRSGTQWCAHGCAHVFASTGRAVENPCRIPRTRRAPHQGSPSLWLLSLGDSRESDSAAAEADETPTGRNPENNDQARAAQSKTQNPAHLAPQAQREPR